MLQVEFVKPLQGHSGCGLNLYRMNNAFFLRKDSGTPSYNRRLKKQFIKQKNFASSFIKTPQILNFGQEDGLFFFDMEFLNGETLAQYMPKLNQNEISELISLLFQSLPRYDNKLSPKADSIFKNKIAEIKRRLNSSQVEARQAVRLLEQFDFSNVPESFCCGDLTLENIMIDNHHQIYLIDFLDSFYNSWLIDVAKLLQDLELHWAYRHGSVSSELAGKLNFAKETLLEKISSQYGTHHIKTIYHILLLNILRIIPYTKDNETAVFLKNATTKVMSTIYQMEN